jgi:outer membrane protein OmpA-like peptidoglycan-associated protein
MRARYLICGLLASAAPVLAMAESTLIFPEGASQKFDQASPSSSYQLPISSYSNGTMKTLLAEGNVVRRVWRVPSSNTKTLDLVSPLRSQLLEQGYEVLFECETRDCGGFDFRFATDVAPEPDMHVDLGDFRFLSARKQDASGDAYLGMLVSRSPERGFIQITEVGSEDPVARGLAVSTKQNSPEDVVAEAEDLSGKLSSKGAVVLEGLEFQKGASALSGDGAGALRELSSYLAEDPNRRIVLVGHTDAEGSLEGNITLSRKRATSVMQSLIDTYGVNADQVSAEGVGFLAPRASNETEEGREQNRRVEVVLTPQP